MRRVVDTNYLKRDEFRDYLAASRENVAVLTSSTELEMLKVEKQSEFLALTEIMARYPGQIIVARDMHAAARLRGRRKGVKKRLTDGKRTSGVRKWLRSHDRIRRGEKSFHLRVKAHEQVLAQLKDEVEGATDFYHDLEQHAQLNYTPDEIAAIRRGDEFSPALRAKVVAAIKEFANRFYAASPYHREPPAGDALHYSFIFRFALCAYLHALHWIAKGGAPGRNPEKMANDLADVTVAAFGTCFDGVLSNDKFVTKLYGQAMDMLKSDFMVGLAPRAQ
jgi:hypothetical protein